MFWETVARPFEGNSLYMQQSTLQYLLNENVSDLVDATVGLD